MKSQCPCCLEVRCIFRKGLCWRCYRDGNARKFFNRKNCDGVTPIDLTSMSLPPAPSATSCLPGSAAKIEVMRRRAEMGYGVLHTMDAVVNVQ